MKKWLLTLLELTKWKDAGVYPSAPELARELTRDPSHVYRELQMMRASGYVRRIEAFEKNPEADYYFYREYGGARGLQFRWRITERGLKRLRMAGLLLCQ